MHRNPKPIEYKTLEYSPRVRSNKPTRLLFDADCHDSREAEREPRGFLERGLSAALGPDNAEVRVSRLLDSALDLLNVFFSGGGE